VGTVAVHFTADETLIGEPGVSSPSALIQNMRALGVSREDVDGVFISHPHMDHVGGLRPFRAARTCAVVLTSTW